MRHDERMWTKRDQIRRDARRAWYYLFALALLIFGTALIASRARGGEPQERMELLWGTPTPVEAYRESYVRGHCGKFTEWTIEYLTADTLKGDVNRKGFPFKADKDVPIEFRATPSDYLRSNDDRGHGAPAGNARRSRTAMAETFLMSNMTPQRGPLNRGPWRLLEHHIRDEIADEEGVEVWVVTLPLFVPDEKTGVLTIRTIGKHHVWEPNFCAKTILIRRGDELEMRAWKCPNVDDPPPFDECETTVDEIEAEAGLNFWSKMDEALQEELEAK